MKLGIIADTHDRLPTFQRAVAMFKRLNVEAIFHAGDYVAPFAAKIISHQALSIPTYCIFGNNDGERAGLKEILPNLVDGPLVVELAGKTVAMHHFLDWFDQPTLDKADIIISGHDHAAKIETRDNKLFVNPGECCGWLTEKCTVALVDTEAMTAQLIEVHP